MLLRKMGILDCRVTSFLAMTWIVSATPRSRQAYFVPRKDAENYAIFNVEMELTPASQRMAPAQVLSTTSFNPQHSKSAPGNRDE